MDSTLIALAHALLDRDLLLVLSAPFVGAFLGAVAERWPQDDTLAPGRSGCPHCKRLLGARNLIPLVSWFTARDRCRHCGQRLSVWYPIVEVSALMIAGWSILAVPAGLAWISSLFGWTLLALAVIDMRWLWLPHALTRPLAIAGLLVTGLWNRNVPFDQLIGAVLGYTAMTVVALLYRRYRGREGLGAGDANLFGALGAWVGWQGLPTVLLCAGISGLLIVTMQLRTGRAVNWATHIPFGPHLCLGGWLVWLYGPVYFGW